MDAHTLTLREDMRYWHDSGLRFVLCDRDVSDLKPAETQQAAHTPPPPGNRTWLNQSASQSQPKQSASNRSARPAPVPPSGVAPSGVQTSQDAPDRQAVSQGAAASDGRHVPQTASGDSDLAVFPWEEFRKKLRVPSRTVWTYWELGEDFGGQPMDERRALFQKITKVLPWPEFSIAFWPLTFLHQGQLIANKGSFLKGVREAGAQTIVVFGEAAFKILKPRTPFVHGRHDMNGKTLIALPGPQEMMSDDQAKRIVWDTLRRYIP